MYLPPFPQRPTLTVNSLAMGGTDTHRAHRGLDADVEARGKGAPEIDNIACVAVVLACETRADIRGARRGGKRKLGGRDIEPLQRHRNLNVLGTGRRDRKRRRGRHYLL